MLPAVASLFHVKNCKAGAARLISTMRDVIKFIFRPSCSAERGLVPRTRTEKYVLFSIPHFSNPGRALHNIRNKVSIFIEVLT